MSTNPIRSLVFLGLALMWPCFAWAAPPTITRLEPTEGSIGDEVNIYGTNFNNVSRVEFTGAIAKYRRISATALAATIPYGGTTPPSTGPIKVTTREGTAFSAETFTVTIGIAPTLETGPPTGMVYLGGLAFQPYAVVDVYFDTTHWGMVFARGDGRFSQSFKAPAKALPGTHWIAAVQRNSGLGGQADFNVRTDWAQFHLDGANRNNRFENVLNPANVEDLNLAATGRVGGISGIVTSQAVEGGMVWVGSNNGEINGSWRHYPDYGPHLKRGCRANLGEAIFGSPPVCQSEVYVGSGKLYTFKIGCGRDGSACKPLLTCVIGIPGSVISDHLIEALNAVNGLTSALAPPDTPDIAPA